MADIWGGHLFNIYYTGHKALLVSLYELLSEKHIVAVSGLGGMGKSELCLEGMDAYKEHYQAIIWLDASSEETMNQELTLMRKVAPSLSQKLIENEKTLLILDNIRDLSLVPPWQGHLLLTTRFAQSRFPMLVMPPLSLEESTLLLLRRGRFISQQGSLDEASESDREVAAEIALELGGYPLALEQAGVHLLLGSSLSDYLSLFRSQPTKFLASRIQDSRWRTEPTLVDVIQETVRQLSPKSKKLLRTLASLSLDAVEWQHPPYDQRIVDELLRVFLVQRGATPTTLSMHRLVRTIIKGAR